MNVTIVDYGMGNVRSLSSALKYLGVQSVVISRNQEVIASADRLVLPGVGSFSEAMSNIENYNIKESIINAVVNNRIPILGVCLGMQLLCEKSDEGRQTKGFGLVPGKITKFEGCGIKVPHIGFNQVNQSKKSKLFKGLKPLSDFYFIHSYKLHCDKDINQSLCNYGGEFIASYEIDNIAGVQFHPELSQTNGLKLLKNFVGSL